MIEERGSMNIRPFSVRDLTALTRMSEKEWDLGQNQSKSPSWLCALLYGFITVAESTELYTLVVNKQKIGLVGFQSFGLKKSLRQKFYQFLFDIFHFSPQIGNREGLYAYYEEYSYIPDDLKIKGNSALSILILDRSFRQQGYGALMMEFIEERMKSLELQQLIVETDESCNVSFYENRDFKKVVELQFSTEKAFVFLKDL